jgi:hypothetical protein
MKSELHILKIELQISYTVLYHKHVFFIEFH